MMIMVVHLQPDQGDKVEPLGKGGVRACAMHASQRTKRSNDRRTSVHTFHTQRYRLCTPVENMFFALCSVNTRQRTRRLCVGRCESSPPQLPPSGCGVESNLEHMQDLFPGRHCITDQDICESHASAHIQVVSTIPSSAKTNETHPYRGHLRRAAATVSPIRISYTHLCMMVSTETWTDSCASALLLDPHDSDTSWMILAE